MERESEVRRIAESDKPSYGVPSMAEIAAIPGTGYQVVSTFSGCGGSCLGYRMAGFRVVWASEFVVEARATYEANHPGCVIDGRDIREVTPADILAATGLAVGELDLLDGSPPCASFSLAGKREAGWGKVKLYSDRAQRTDDLFFEYARLLRGLQPKTFVAENVAGLARGTAKGYFKLILAELKDCGYDVEARLVNAAWLGVPQSRERLIFIGVRTDLCERFGVAPVFPKPLPYCYTVTDACPWIAAKRSDSDAASDPNTRAELAAVDIGRYAIGAQWDELAPGQTHEKRFNLAKAHPNRPCPTITATGGNLGAAAVVHPFEKRKFTIREVKLLSGFPEDFVLTGLYIKQWERIGRAVPPVMMAHVARTVRDEVLCKSQ
jgi:DNA (cytosine-5)-methyltransferase 1